MHLSPRPHNLKVRFDSKLSQNTKTSAVRKPGPLREQNQIRQLSEKHNQAPKRQSGTQLNQVRRHTHPHRKERFEGTVDAWKSLLFS